MKLIDTLRRIRWRAKAALGLDYYHKTTISRPLEVLGKGPCQWTVLKGSLSRDSVIYTVGVGENIDFDLDIIARYGATVHAFDPTPKAVLWVSRQNLPSEFIFHEYGVSGEDLLATFFAPENPLFDAYTARSSNPNLESVSLPVKRLSTIMAELGHTHLDLLKLDIEGFEYEVVRDLVMGELPIGQILVEFHHRFDTYSLVDTATAVQLLLDAGYSLCYTSSRGEEYSFFRLSMTDKMR